MYCSHCGKTIEEYQRFCSNCGKPHEEVPVLRQKIQSKPKQKSFLLSLFDWSLTDAELREQVDKYYQLGWGHSYRKVATSALIFIALSSALIIALGLNLSSWIDVAVIGFLALFVLNGSRTALVVTMLYWTAGKIWLITQGGNALVQFFWWATFMGIFWKAFRVEQYRARYGEGRPEGVGYEKGKPSAARKIYICLNCGEQSSLNGLCQRCGRNLVLFDDQTE